jgi:hypothetical protein
MRTFRLPPLTRHLHLLIEWAQRDCDENAEAENAERDGEEEERRSRKDGTSVQNKHADLPFVVAAVAHQCPSLRSLELRLSVGDDDGGGRAEDTFAPLESLQHLKRFELRGNGYDCDGNEQAHWAHWRSIRRMRALRCVHFPEQQEGVMLRVFGEPEALDQPLPPLEELSFGVVRSAADADVLARFGAAGSMQRLEGKIGVQLRDCSFLQSFSCLRELHLTCEDEQFPGGRSFARALECMTELRVLYLKAAPLSTDHLIDVLASMPHLRELTLHDSWVPSLSFIALADVRGKGALSASLRSLEFNRLRAVHGRDVLWYLRGSAPSAHPALGLLFRRQSPARGRGSATARTGAAGEQKQECGADPSRRSCRPRSCPRRGLRASNCGCGLLPFADRVLIPEALKPGKQHNYCEAWLALFLLLLLWLFVFHRSHLPHIFFEYFNIAGSGTNYQRRTRGNSKRANATARQLSQAIIPVSMFQKNEPAPPPAPPALSWEAARSDG